MPCVLVVDDDRPFQRIVADMLSELGCEVLLAGNGTEALEHLLLCVPDVLVTDLNMPGVDGWALVATCRNEPRLRSLPIVVMTANTDVQLQALANLNVNDVVAKPFDLHVLVSTITSLLSA